MRRSVQLLIWGVMCAIFAVTFNGNDVAAAGMNTKKSGINRDASISTQSPIAIDSAAAALAGVSRDVLKLAIGAVSCAVSSGDITAPPTLTLIDYSRPSTEPRLWVFDVKTGDMLFKELVAHGRNTGENTAKHFSDAADSHQSSLGLFVTGDTYVGSNGYSLRLNGLEPGFNGNAWDRAIVMHGAPYVDAAVAVRQGRLGRSWGCPALREAVARRLIDTVRGGGVIFSYYPDSDWLKTSRFLNGCGASVVAAASWTNTQAARKDGDSQSE